MERRVGSEDAMGALGRSLAPILRRGDCLLLRGDLGAGKTTLARSIIQALAGARIDVGSPTYALVELYEMDIPVHHVDLYRLEAFEQAFELGLEDLIEAGITLVEWPERAEAIFPGDALDLTIEEEKEGIRMVRFGWKDGDWAARLSPMFEEPA
ncbi:tRNA (adenosine(37)-N6)-threonylcarbamoyltransferase complex ATPase subunit type 1 TsaE [Parvularcula maris]|uniref:tRNA threonylcarbamoyladenosine biosynthesis protein TsaE n=1 Tax=Parvularcula maris TaxID=2965077 RepID=A0A9X2RJG6_9PROT|nr:tRNA (adenosine(37)-N6)-threonylcarbamoyltransferase complex ATPase subunit type 1 TsaE [Parvularcula maris]MCQ8184712.1 tRNA (adenosine(37)-N6)-threonylcarbamoyltransferase complex ATPase subunit type 1 TsaE [Parvularcula maris]